MNSAITGFRRASLALAAAGAVAVVAATISVSTTAVTANASGEAQSGGAKGLVLQIRGPVTGDPSGCLHTAVQSTSGQTVGEQTFCLDSITGGPAGDWVGTGHASLGLPAGDLTGTAVSKSNVITPFASGALAIPGDVGDPSDVWVSFVEDRTITGGTKSYRSAAGSIRVFGVLVVRNGAAVWINATATADVR